MSGPDWYRWYPSKWAQGVLGLTPEQRGVYIDIINIVLDRGSCPEDYSYLAKACNCRRDKVRRIVDSLIARGKLNREMGELLQKKARREREDSQFFSELQRKRANSRYAKSHKNNELADAISGSANTTTEHKKETQSPSTQPETLPPQSVTETTSPTQTAPPLGANGHAKPKSEARGSRLSDDWKPSEAAINFCRVELGASADILNREYAAFMDWGLSAVGPASRKRNWDRAFLNWIRRAMNVLREQEARERRWAEQRRSQ
jgi:hypothetical protein